VLCPVGDGEDRAPLGEDFGDGERPIAMVGNDRGMDQGDGGVRGDTLDEHRDEERGGRRIANRTDRVLYKGWGTEVRGRLAAED
jgi:hypothetical protein